jgi:5'-3' exonuclease
MATRNPDSGVRSAVEEASGYALVLNQLFSHTRQDQTSEGLEKPHPFQVLSLISTKLRKDSTSVARTIFSRIDLSRSAAHTEKLNAAIEGNMAKANSKDKDERTPQEPARAPIEAYPTKAYEPGSGEQLLARKGRHLDVDGILARSFRDVKSISLALNQQGLEQGKAT